MRLRRIAPFGVALAVALLGAMVFGVASAGAAVGGNHPSLVGAGTYGSIVNCELKFAVVGFLDGSGKAHGFQSATAPADNCGVGPGGGELRATVTCVGVLGNTAEVRGIVTESTGPLFSTYLGIHQGDVLFTQGQENTAPVPDQVFQDKGLPGTQNACVGEIDPLKFPLDSGDIEVHD